MPVVIDPNRVLQVFEKSGNAPLKAKDVGKALGLSADDRSEVREELRALAKKGKLVALDGKRYVLPGAIDAHKGTVQRKQSGVGWFLPDDPKLPDGFLPPGELVSLVDGDKVMAELSRGARGPIARVVRIIERRKTPLVGVLVVRDKSAFVEVDGNALSGPVIVDGREEMHGMRHHGEIVEVAIDTWPSNTSVAQGHVVKSLGKRGALDVEVEKILLEKGVWRPFPPTVVEDAESFPPNPTAEDSAGRTDLRKMALVTIDGETAKDFDDAVHAEKHGKNIIVTVAIADVSHYVRTGKPLDDEARKRGTSVYWPGSVVPMLPEALSNGLCSLKPNVDRLCLCAQFTVGPDGAVHDERFFTGVMKSHARLTYTIVQKFLDGASPAEIQDIPAHTHGSLRACHEASLRLRKAREERGALDFELPELKIDLDTSGTPTKIVPLTRLYAHKLIEDLMVAANEAVAREFEAKNWPSVYRVHEPPDDEKLERFIKLARLTAQRKLTELEKGHSPKALMKLMRALSDHPAKRALETLLLRSMMQAKYFTQNLGHYGLGSSAYLHFTSPIRRYPDLVVHRLLKDRLATGGKRTPPKKGAHASDHDPHERVEKRGKHSEKRGGHADADERLLRELDDIAGSSSDRERAASEVERAVDQLMCAWLMKDKVGQRFKGRVQGVAEFGLFVLLEPDTVEGLVHVANMPEDFWQYDEVQLALVGERSGRRFTVGDEVDVVVANVDIGRRQVALSFAEGEGAQRAAGLTGPERLRAQFEQRHRERDARGARGGKGSARGPGKGGSRSGPSKGGKGGKGGKRR